MNEQRSPGWYDDGHGQTRWWSGRGWTTHTRAKSDESAPITAVPAAPAPDLEQVITAPTGAGARSGYRGRTVLLTAGAAALLGLFLGVGAGTGGTPASDPTTAPAYLALQSRLTSTLTERDALKAAAVTADSTAQQLAADQAALAEATDALHARTTALDEREAKLVKKAKALARTVKSSTTSSTPKAKPAAPVSVYYQNCDAARAAGAAPVHRGDPGYASHLDRDGDGVGCE